MGKKLDPNKIRVNPRKFFQQTGGDACYEETIAFMDCMRDFKFEVDDNCLRQRVAMLTCAERQVKKQKQKATINYHLQRIARLMKK